MKSWVLAAGLLVAAGAASPNASAADLDEGPPPDRYGSAYDDPRYADIYRRPPPPVFGVPPHYGAPVPRERVFRDDEDDHEPPRYSYNDPRAGYRGACTPREVIRDRMARHGWHDFHGGALRGEVAVVRARRPNGRLFELSVDRCSGEILSAHPLEGRTFGPYAYGHRPWWQRAY